KKEMNRFYANKFCGDSQSSTSSTPTTSDYYSQMKHINEKNIPIIPVKQEKIESFIIDDEDSINDDDDSLTENDSLKKTDSTIIKIENMLDPQQGESQPASTSQAKKRGR